ncbi:MAG: hypothetical protein HFJ50_04365 [Clostridia bacterium]|jgi:hypothetical protein|nr:hypothetical protein [Clostridia bacterium]
MKCKCNTNVIKEEKRTGMQSYEQKERMRKKLHSLTILDKNDIICLFLKDR